MKIVVNKDLIVTDIALNVKESLKQQTSFVNPEYQDAKKFKRSTYGIKKTIKLYKTTKDGLILPRGCLHKAFYLAEGTPDLSIQTSIFDKREIKSKIQLRPMQIPWVNSMLQQINGIGVAPAGSGKTICGLCIIAELGQPTLWLTHRQSLVDQLHERAEAFLDVGVLGELGNNKFEFGDVITTGMIQTLAKKDLASITNKFGTVIVDEVHNSPAHEFYSVVRQLNPHYLFGLTATPYREDRLEQIMYDTIGPSIAVMDRQELIEAGGILPAKIIVRETNARSHISDYAKLISFLETNGPRNMMIVTDIVTEVALGNTCIALTSRVNHGSILKNLLHNFGVEAEHVHATISNKKKQKAIQRFKSGEVPLLIATYRMLGEGFDHQPTNRMFFTLPHKAKGLIEQAKGRIERICEGKKDALLYDYADNKISIFRRQYETRLEQYQDQDLEIIDSF